MSDPMRALDRRLSGRYRVVTMFVNVPYAVACIAREQPSAAVWSMPVCRVLRFFSINYFYANRVRYTVQKWVISVVRWHH